MSTVRPRANKPEMKIDNKREQGFEKNYQSKLLSLIITGRNDNYMGNFKYRITSCINYLSINLKNLGRLDDVEIVVTDWNSDVPLAKVLPLLPEAREICRFVYVPPAVAAAALQEPGKIFSSTWSQNTGLRRSQGEFLMYLVADTLVPSHSLQTLFSLLEGKLAVPVKLAQSLFQCGRKQIPAAIVKREPSLEEWDRYLLLNGAELPQEPGVSGIGMCTAAQMMHRSLWYACRGNNQQFKNQGWTDIELTLRVTQDYPWVDLSSLGVLMFEMNHWLDSHSEPRAQKLTPHIVSSSFAVNDENWGLGDCELDIQTAENISQIPTETGSENTDSPLKHLNQTREELLDRLTSKQVRQHLQKNNARWWKINSTELAIQYALGWYSLYCEPRNYLEFGMIIGYAATVVAAAYPNIEIYGIESWQKANENGSIPSPYGVWDMLHSIGYQGYIRLVSGDLRTAFRRLRDSYVGKLEIDLVLVRGDIFGMDAIEQMSQVVPHLAPGGCIVFTCNSDVTFEAVWSQMQQKFPQFTYFECKRLKIGLALVESLPNSKASDSLKEETVLAKAWSRSPKLSRWRVLWIRLKRSWGIIRGRIA